MENLRAEWKSKDKTTLDDITLKPSKFPRGQSETDFKHSNSHHITLVLLENDSCKFCHQQNYHFQNSGHARHRGLHTRDRHIPGQNLFAIVANIARKSLGST
jgi:hypothetical protein